MYSAPAPCRAEFPKRNWDPVVGSVCVVFLDPDILDVKQPYYLQDLGGGGGGRQYTILHADGHYGH